MRRFVFLFVTVFLVAAVATAATALPQYGSKTLRILVTNDDGVGAPGIAALVDALQTLPNVQVRVVAPATNQSGTSDNFSTTPLTVTPATTASGDAATAVGGFPADSVLYDVLGAHDHPDLVVSGINLGQNLGNVATLSGTVGAARTANRLGIPAIAVSQGIGSTIDYPTGARVAVAIVSQFRQDYAQGRAAAQTLNVNVPSCTTGSIRGVRLEPLGRTTSVSNYTASGTVGNGVFTPVVTNENALAAANCASTLRRFGDDIQAFNNGFVPVTVLNPDLTDPFAFTPAAQNAWRRVERRLDR
jgi:5'-nucleotidase